MQVHIIVQRFKQSVSYWYYRHGNTGRPKAIRSSASSEQVNSVIEEMHQYVRRLLCNLIIKQSMYKMLRYDLDW